LFKTDSSKIDNGFYLGAAVYSPQLELYLMLKLPENISIFLLKLGQSIMKFLLL